MCGIVGYIGPRIVHEVLLEGLRRLEYRGYDSAGICTVAPTLPPQISKAVGRIANLTEKVEALPTSHSYLGIGHTRWATHGPATENNAHPHIGGEGEIIVVHNGVIENYAELKQRLISRGYRFASDTDTEVVAHLLAEQLKHEKAPPSDEPLLQKERLLRVVRNTLSQLRGTFGLVILFREQPDLMIAARLGSPLVIGVGDDEHFISSDAAALAGYTNQIVYLADHQVAIVTREKLEVRQRDDGLVKHNVQTLQFNYDDVSLGTYPHYMLKEIHEQPQSLRNALRGRLCDDEATAKFGGLNLNPRELRDVKRIVLTACGTSWHAALVGEYMLEEIAHIPVEVEYASELRYRSSPMQDGTLVFAITQSGETADTLGALREMKRKGHRALAICNVVGSTIAQEADGGIYLHAGPEIGVASTKAYTSQCMVFAMLALYFGRLRHLSYDDGREMIEQLRALPTIMERALEVDSEVRRIAEKYHQATNFLYLGRHYNFPTALEGALKLKEISYIHAEGYPAAEMKHGPIALVDKVTPSVFVMPRGFIYDKVMSNVEEIKARGGPVIAIADEGDQRIAEIADDVIYIPSVEEYLQPFVASVPLQLLAYHIAILRGCDVDKPRNLAKSVTVE